MATFTDEQISNIIRAIQIGWGEDHATAIDHGTHVVVSFEGYGQAGEFELRRKRQESSRYIQQELGEP
ncbi:MAG TPA: hypothetical protein VH593_30735 [Ktedonobacteraceae bacterium]